MLSERVKALKDLFGVELTDYGREDASGVLFSSGCGIGMALMDQCKTIRYFVDVDNYRFQQIDWESLGVVLSVGQPSVVVLAGWFSIDRPRALEAIQKGIAERSRVVFYTGGDRMLSEAIEEIEPKKTRSE